MVSTVSRYYSLWITDREKNDIIKTTNEKTTRQLWGDPQGLTLVSQKEKRRICGAGKKKKKGKNNGGKIPRFREKLSTKGSACVLVPQPPDREREAGISHPFGGALLERGRGSPTLVWSWFVPGVSGAELPLLWWAGLGRGASHAFSRL